MCNNLQTYSNTLALVMQESGVEQKVCITQKPVKNIRNLRWPKTSF